MADLGDVQGYGRKFDNQRELLAEADIDERDRDAITAFIAHEDAQDHINTGTLVSHLNRLRLSAERADTPLVEMDHDAVNVFLTSLNHDHGLSEGTRRNYRKALRLFFKWRDKDWAEDIRIGASPKRSVEPSELLSKEEVDELLEASSNLRDKALIALLADTGLRIGAAVSLRIRDVDFSGRIATAQPNQNANVKDAEDPVPITWSRGHLASWLDMHPRRWDSDAPFFIKRDHIEEDDDGAMTYQYAARRIKWVADDAGIDRGRVNTHNFRKSAISRWIREGLSEQVIKHRVHWADDSTRFETYSGVSAEEMNEDIAEIYGLVDSEDALRPQLEQCTQCQAPLRDTARFCPGCGAPLTAQAAESVTDADDNIDDSIEVALDGYGREKIESLLEFRKELNDDPELRAWLLDH